MRWNGPWITYRFPKQTHTGKFYIQLDPMEFLTRISKFIPYPRRHRRHYHGVFAPNARLRKQITDNGCKIRQSSESPKVEKIHIGWAKLIARIYVS